MTCSIAILALLWWPGTEATVSPRNACTGKYYENSVSHSSEAPTGATRQVDVLILFIYYASESGAGYRPASTCSEVSPETDLDLVQPWSYLEKARSGWDLKADALLPCFRRDPLTSSFYRCPVLKLNQLSSHPTPPSARVHAQ